ncbi:MAG: hypothetical protein COS92_04855, partial [Desulfobacterales bacterium CG07_land_8_20_14_0_80_52_14]
MSFFTLFLFFKICLVKKIQVSIYSILGIMQRKTPIIEISAQDMAVLAQRFRQPAVKVCMLLLLQRCNHRKEIGSVVNRRLGIMLSNSP